MKKTKLLIPTLITTVLGTIAMPLICCSGKPKSTMCTITFINGDHYYFSDGDNVRTVVSGTKFGDVAKPRPICDYGYDIESWSISDDTVINSNISVSANAVSQEVTVDVKHDSNVTNIECESTFVGDWVYLSFTTINNKTVKPTSQVKIGDKNYTLKDFDYLYSDDETNEGTRNHTLIIDSEVVKAKSITIDLITSEKIEATQISIMCSSTLYKGSSEKVKVSYSPENATEIKAKWESSNTSVVSVDDYGNIYASGAGDADVTATLVSSKHTSSCSVHVELPQPRTESVTLNYDEQASSSVQHVWTADVNWVSSNTKYQFSISGLSSKIYKTLTFVFTPKTIASSITWDKSSIKITANGQTITPVSVSVASGIIGITIDGSKIPSGTSYMSIDATTTYDCETSTVMWQAGFISTTM